MKRIQLVPTLVVVLGVCWLAGYLMPDRQPVSTSPEQPETAGQKRLSPKLFPKEAVEIQNEQLKKQPGLRERSQLEDGPAGAIRQP
jgi:hypothetical protein